VNGAEEHRGRNCDAVDICRLREGSRKMRRATGFDAARVPLDMAPTAFRISKCAWTVIRGVSMKEKDGGRLDRQSGRAGIDVYK
jgi:hypothetical protein